MPFPVSVLKKAVLCIYSHMIEFLSPVDTVFSAIEAHSHVAHRPPLPELCVPAEWDCLFLPAPRCSHGTFRSSPILRILEGQNL